MPQIFHDSLGVAHSFPDGVTPEEIAAAVGISGGVAPGPAPAEVRSAPPQVSGPMRYLRGANEAANRGLLRGLGFLGDILPRGDAAMADYLGMPEGSTFSSFPTTNELMDFAGRRGLPLASADVIPQPGWERPAAEAISGATSSLPFLAVGAPPISTIAAGVAGGAAGEIAHEFAPESTVGPIVAGALAGGPMGLRRGQTAERIASKLGSSETMEHAGIVLEDAATNWRKTTFDPSNPESKISIAAAPLDAAIPGTSTVVPSEILSRARDLLARGGGSARAVRDFFDTTIKSGGALGQTAKLLNAGAPITWEEGRAFRTELGTALRDAKAGSAREAIEHLYGGVTADLGTTAETAGAGDLFRNFNEVSTRLHELDSGPIEAILSGKQPADAALRLLTQARRGGEILRDLRGEIPEAVDELAAAHLRSQTGAWSRLSPEGREALIIDPDLRATADSLAPPRSAAASGRHSLQALVGGGLAHAAGIVSGALFPTTAGVNPLVTGAASEIGGILAPSIWRGGRSLVRQSPQLAVPSLAGGVGGANALIPIPQDFSEPFTGVR